MIKNAADPAQIKEAVRKEKSARFKELEDVKSILSTKAGRRFYYRYMKECGVFRISYTGNGSETFFNEGQRNVGLKFLADINDADPEIYATMIKENQEEKPNVS